MCKTCKNPKDSEGKFSCRTPFSDELISANKGHFASKNHRDKIGESTPSGSNNNELDKFLQPKAPPPAPQPELQQAEAPNGSANVEALAEVVPMVPKEPVRCEGLGFERTDPSLAWQDLFRAHVTYIDGSVKSSNKFVVDKVGTNFIARSADCTGVGAKGYQHKVVCCKQCSLCG